MEGCGAVWEGVAEATKVAREKGGDPLSWAVEVTSMLNSAGVELPSPRLAHMLVEYICWDNNVPVMWKLLDKAIAFGIAPPLLVIALLSSRIIPVRRCRPAPYRLYLEIVKRHAFALKFHVLDHPLVLDSIDAAMQLRKVFGHPQGEPGVTVAKFIFCVVWQLLDASLDDEGLLELAAEKNLQWELKSLEMGVDGDGTHDDEWPESYGKLRNQNTTAAIELIGQFLQDGVTSRIICLAQRNLPKQWEAFAERLQLLSSNSVVLRDSKFITPKAFKKLVADAHTCFRQQCRTISNRKFSLDISSGIPASYSGRSDEWLPLDLVLEDCMDGYEVAANSAIETIVGVTKSLQAINSTSWHNAFLELWVAALHLVQRERNPIEGPMPRLDTRLCMLLSIVPLVIAEIIEEDEGSLSDDGKCGGDPPPGSRRCDLISSLQILGAYQGILTPPDSIVSAANQAAVKAMLFLSGIHVGNSHFECIGGKDVLPFQAVGNMRHLIVEACIARNLLDTSSYFWPGYVNGHIDHMLPSVPPQASSWTSFMNRAALTPALVNALVSSPASSLAELEKVFEIAINGRDDEKVSAASILCGVSLLRGWNIQEHTVYFITRLLSPAPPANHTGNESHLIGHALMLNVLIIGIASVDCVQIFSLHGLVPQLACSLMPICEVFGSCVPSSSWTLANGEEISAHAVFSNAFALLLKLWRFNHPPLDYGVGDVPTVGSRQTPEHLLLVRNALLLSSGSIRKNRNKSRLLAAVSLSSPEPVFMDSFPKLKVWYRQHQACMASILSGIVGTPVRQIVDSLLAMVFPKIGEGSRSLNSGSSSGSSSGSQEEDATAELKLPAWDILEAVPYVVDAALTTCSHGMLSPRELATGLKNLADFLPASLVTIIGYFSAEVTRSISKPVFMNGTDWPSPAANLACVEEQIKNILAATGVMVPTLAAGGSSPATLPLPLAAFVSLTITYKIDKASERFLNLAGPALESLAAGCPWPCMPIVASLWTQKAKRWTDFLVFSASRTIFLHNRDTIVQLLKSCFSATLGLKANAVSSTAGVGALLGHGFGSHFCCGLSPAAPGILYLRVYRSVKDIAFLLEEIISLLMHSMREIAHGGMSREIYEKLKCTNNGKRYARISLPKAMKKVKAAASLAAALVWLSGGFGLVQSLIKETLPSWFITVHEFEKEEGREGVVSALRGYALAYFTILCGAFAWGVDSTMSVCRRRVTTLNYHLEFLARALDGKISLGCNLPTWRAYVSGFVSLMVGCFPNWVLEVNDDVLKKLARGLGQWNEDDLALALLGAGGNGTMGTAVELIIRN
ncbi:hypothetical protein MLD38_016885 [Melastoma candidum]|uniref:Uncharacterized protein n=1 Tax=Melastoma candidum TaxID=119954 RepID=A0ACB9QQ52_9MYRT|nr:hypothetical protein MLD38_016885 [Melastoma candidum]